MPGAQRLLFADPQPLVERLGSEFFRQAPERPGVYLMRDANDVILYVGKAKNLRKRLGSYRVANPDRMPSRHLRLLRAVARIELQECADESSALAREAELLREARPRFNRIGTWRAPPRFFAWRISGHALHLAVAADPEPDWRCQGPLGRTAVALRAILARLLWLAVHPALGFAGLPIGWAHGRLNAETTIHCGLQIEMISFNLERLLSGQSTEFCAWIQTQLSNELSLFDMGVVKADLEVLMEASPLAKHHRPVDDDASPPAPARKYTPQNYLLLTFSMIALWFLR